MTLIICVKTYVKLGLLKEIGVVTLVCLIYVPDVKDPSINFFFKTLILACLTYGFISTLRTTHP